jgi:hypothetical protein
MFLILRYTMGLATVMSKLIGLMHLSPNISQPPCPYLIMLLDLSNSALLCSMHFLVVPRETRKYL